MKLIERSTYTLSVQVYANNVQAIIAAKSKRLLKKIVQRSSMNG